ESKGEHIFPVLVQRNAEPWTAQATFNAEIKAGEEGFSTVFNAMEAEPAQIIFHLGGSEKPWRFCLDDVAISEARPEEIAAAAKTATRSLPALVNQAGY